MPSEIFIRAAFSSRDVATAKLSKPDDLCVTGSITRVRELPTNGACRALLRRHNHIVPGRVLDDRLHLADCSRYAALRMEGRAEGQDEGPGPVDATSPYGGTQRCVDSSNPSESPAELRTGDRKRQVADAASGTSRPDCLAAESSLEQVPLRRRRPLQRQDLDFPRRVDLVLSDPGVIDINPCVAAAARG